MIKPYSFSRDGSQHVSKHFQVYEFKCRQVDCILIDTDLVDILEQIRVHFDKPVYVNSGYRTPEHNASVGGDKYSHHMYGMAADIRIPGITPRQIADYADSLMPDRGWIGCYASQGFVHVDVWPQRARWQQ